MPFKPHGRQYDIVVFGATGYTGLYAAEHIATHLPTNLKWAIAGRSRDKLEKIAADVKKLNPDRQPVSIEVCGLNASDLDHLATKTFILMTMVGPYGAYGDFAFKACAEHGTHYLDCTGEVPFVARMIKKYEDTAKSTGALMFPQIGVDSAPPDLVAWSLATLNRSELNADTRDVTVSVLLNAAPSGGTLATVFTLFDNFTMKEVKASHVPFALSPMPHEQPVSARRSFLSRLTGLVRVPKLGLLTTSLSGGTDAPIVQRTWGLLPVNPSRKGQFYGPNFTFREFTPTPNWLRGMAQHFALTLFGLLLIAPPLRRLAWRFVHQPGQGPDREAAKKDRVEYRGVGAPDLESTGGKQAFCRAHFQGSMYYLTAVLMAQAAMTLLEDDVGLEGGIFTPACLGQPYIDRLDAAGFKFESEMLHS